MTLRKQIIMFGTIITIGGILIAGIMLYMSTNKKRVEDNIS